MARFCPLFSSSSGNSIYIGAADGGILIDVGVSAKQTQLALQAINVDPGSIHAICITHEHSDHIRGLRVFAARHKIPVYTSAGTLQELTRMGVADGSFQTQVIAEEGICAGGMQIHAFRTSHDSAESVGYTIQTPDNKRICVATDLGEVTPQTKEALLCSDLVMLESNHDINMLQNGAYPYYLKRRILSKTGHLSNESCAETAVSLLESGTTRLVLGHLSRENNLPQLALETTRAALAQTGAAMGRDYLLQVAGQTCEVIGF